MLPPAMALGFGAAVLAICAMALLAYGALQAQAGAAVAVSRTFVVREQIDQVLASLRDAETGQRGYLLTGDVAYLEPHARASTDIPHLLQNLAAETADQPAQQGRISSAKDLIAAKLAELQETINLQRTGRHNEAVAVVRTDRGKVLMDRLRDGLREMDAEEQRMLAVRSAEWRERVFRSGAVTLGGSALLLVLVVAAAALTARELRRRARAAWISEGQGVISAAVIGEQHAQALAQRALESLSRYCGAVVSAFYVGQDDGTFRRLAGQALPAQAPDSVRAGAGVVGQAVVDGRLIHLPQLPQDFLAVEAGVGRTAPVDLLVLPTSVDGRVNGVVELAFLRRAEGTVADLLDAVSGSLGLAMQTALYRERLALLLARTQKQAEELQAQQEELRMSNEELEEQSRSLEESQARLETQQAELEQINQRLQEQANLLQRQKADVLVAKAEVEQANWYKSRFLANMSHELRTPLNSSLILAKLLADNKSGNLTPEQVRFAETIHSAGNDLLGLINDILDLSKIEAGQVEVQSQPTPLPALLQDLTRTFQPLADQKSLTLSLVLDAGAPEIIEVDRQKLEQIARNLLSNGLKFTEKGSVSLRVFAVGATSVAFAVRDSGIGIEPEQQERVFHAFHQADAEISRKYGGTGLGLSISRDLARLMGGDIQLTSAPGQGSTFTLTLPRLPVDQRAPRRALTPGPIASQRLPIESPRDGEELAAPLAAGEPPARLLLIVEDDPSFAEILVNAGEEQGFECLVATSADEGFRLAVNRVPSAILLDLRLPDHSGLSVLDRVKRNPATRHVPVHVISGLDQTQTALEMGAVGYALKPVAREQLGQVLARLAQRAQSRVGRVLIVEDDEIQRDSIARLLGGDGVQTVGVDKAEAALAHLRENTFDCMVMDLKLPDASGFELLETMAKDERYAFPPVIVYTAGNVSLEDEERLRRFSRSIIIKGARSPERLLDEVMLFLHQVEAQLPPERRRMLQQARDREAIFENRVVLIVEDDVRNVFALTSLLEPRGARVLIARNGREALEVVAREPRIDLILMDIMMPEMDGLEATRRIRAGGTRDKLPIIALTAKAMRDDHDRCLAAGANDYVAKPIDVDKLLSLMRIWMPK
jgi:signal transduction histidine kinase/CheY-like chemotaxis protein/CHASE3 domain sensor protein